MSHIDEAKDDDNEDEVDVPYMLSWLADRFRIPPCLRLRLSVSFLLLFPPTDVGIVDIAFDNGQSVGTTPSRNRYLDRIRDPSDGDDGAVVLMMEMPMTMDRGLVRKNFAL
jgi:hypothetical protein